VPGRRGEIGRRESCLWVRRYLEKGRDREEGDVPVGEEIPREGER
jgi:hypothetical protein